MNRVLRREREREVRQSRDRQSVPEAAALSVFASVSPARRARAERMARAAEANQRRLRREFYERQRRAA